MNKYQEALNRLLCNTDYNDYSNQTITDVSEDIVTLQELVEKETPLEVDHTSDGYPDDYYLVYDIAFCPNCDRAFEVTYNEHYKYCPSCGQRLNWGDKDE